MHDNMTKDRQYQNISIDFVGENKGVDGQKFVKRGTSQKGQLLP